MAIAGYETNYLAPPMNRDAEKNKRICTTDPIKTILYKNFVADKMAQQDMLISFVAILEKLRRGIRHFYCNWFQAISNQSSFLHKQLRGVQEWPF